MPGGVGFAVSLADDRVAACCERRRARAESIRVRRAVRRAVRREATNFGLLMRNPKTQQSPETNRRGHSLYTAGIGCLPEASWCVQNSGHRSATSFAEGFCSQVRVCE